MSGRRGVAALVASAALIAIPSLAAAHAHLESTDPAAGSNLDEPPIEVVLTFDGELQPDGTGFTVTDDHEHEVGSGELDLTVADRNVISGAVEISEPGIYTVSWTAVAEDGHRDSGEFSFGYRAEEEVPHEEDDGHGDAPDTAVTAPGGVSPLVLAGALLLTVGGMLLIRRILVR
jgi:copper resistance protein C